MLLVAELGKDRSEILGDLGCMIVGMEFGLEGASLDSRLDLRLKCDGSATEHEDEPGNGPESLEVSCVCGIDVPRKKSGLQWFWRRWQRWIGRERLKHSNQERWKELLSPKVKAASLSHTQISRHATESVVVYFRWTV